MSLGGSPIDLGDLRSRHAVFQQGTDARELRRRDLALRLRADRRLDLLETDRRHRRHYSQHTRFAGRLVV